MKVAEMKAELEQYAHQLSNQGKNIAQLDENSLAQIETEAMNIESRLKDVEAAINEFTATREKLKQIINIIITAIQKNSQNKLDDETAQNIASAAEIMLKAYEFIDDQETIKNDITTAIQVIVSYKSTQQNTIMQSLQRLQTIWEHIAQKSGLTTQTKTAPVITPAQTEIASLKPEIPAIRTKTTKDQPNTDSTAEAQNWIKIFTDYTDKKMPQIIAKAASQNENTTKQQLINTAQEIKQQEQALQNIIKTGNTQLLQNKLAYLKIEGANLIRQADAEIALAKTTLERATQKTTQEQPTKTEPPKKRTPKEVFAMLGRINTQLDRINQMTEDTRKEEQWQEISTWLKEIKNITENANTNPNSTTSQDIYAQLKQKAYYDTNLTKIEIINT
ncbi:hypothetical protein HY486_03905 [Candidatus Woesearchaeota archaeon]|nr:hypothetical protein [Candidatus Woesearchaeota archaeon]